MLLARLLRLPVALAIALGLVLAPTAPAEAQLWKPDKKKPATATKAKKKPTKRKAAKPTKRKSAKAKRKAPKRAAPRSRDVDDTPVITIYVVDDED